MVTNKPMSVALLPDFLAKPLSEAYEFHDRLHEFDPAAFEAIAPRIRGLVSSGEGRVSAALLAKMPAVEIISVFGVGYDGVDVNATRERGIVVTNTPDVLTDDVADLAMGLLIAVARQIVYADRYVRSGRWAEGPLRLTRKVSGSRLGIFGLGRIGTAIARRAEGFGMQIAYTATAQKPVAHKYYQSALAMANDVDFFVVSAYGGPATKGLINADILNAPGPKGALINIARGTVVDESALVEALKSGRLGAAGLDVLADEPNVPRELLEMDNVVLTPHMASGTWQTRKAMADLALANLDAHFAGRAVLTPILQ
jgi:lactate dehydrogenase-like 2-hydroxyacid dehydrogenase